MFSRGRERVHGDKWVNNISSCKPHFIPEDLRSRSKLALNTSQLLHHWSTTSSLVLHWSQGNTDVKEQTYMQIRTENSNL